MELKTLTLDQLLEYLPENTYLGNNTGLWSLSNKKGIILSSQNWYETLQDFLIRYIELNFKFAYMENGTPVMFNCWLN
jgi:hypothetical protein